MTQYTVRAVDEREDARNLHGARLVLRAQRRARRHAFWRRVSDLLLSMPAGIGVRIGG